MNHIVVYQFAQNWCIRVK